MYCATKKLGSLVLLAMILCSLGCNLFEASYWKAIKEYKKENYNQAIALLNKDLLANKTNIKALRLRGRCYNIVNKPNLALVDFNSIIEIDMNDTSSYYYRGFTFLVLKEYSNAEKDFSHYIKLVNDNSSAYYYRALSNFGIRKEFEGCGDLYMSKEFGNKAAGALLNSFCI